MDGPLPPRGLRQSRREGKGSGDEMRIIGVTIQLDEHNPRYLARATQRRGFFATHVRKREKREREFDGCDGVLNV